MASMGLACVAGLWSAGSFVEYADAAPTPLLRDDCSSSTIVLTRAEVDDILKALEAPTTSCSIVPAFEGGKTIGFKVFSVRPGSLGARLCLQNGDVVTHANVDGRGYDMASPETGLAMFAQLRKAARVDVELRRKGEPVRVSYVIQ